MIKNLVLQNVMAEKRITKAQLSKMVGISETSIYNILSTGKCKISTAKKIAESLSIPLVTIVEEQYLPIVEEFNPVKTKLFLEQRVEILEHEVVKLKEFVEDINNRLQSFRK